MCGTREEGVAGGAGSAGSAEGEVCALPVPRAFADSRRSSAASAISTVSAVSAQPLHPDK